MIALGVAVVGIMLALLAVLVGVARTLRASSDNDRV